MKCPRCEAAGPIVGWASSGEPPTTERVCGFGAEPENEWNCATIAALRIACIEHGTVSVHNDQSIATLSTMDAVEPCWLVMGWYKSRGSTESICLIGEGPPKPCTLGQAEAIIKHYEEERT